MSNHLSNFRVLENGKMECWVCKLQLNDSTELKKHMLSMLHKENAKTHCIYKRLKEPSPDKPRADTVFKVPEPKNSPLVPPRKSSFGSEMAMGDIPMSPQPKSTRQKSPSPSPVRNPSNHNSIDEGNLEQIRRN